MTGQTIITREDIQAKTFCEEMNKFFGQTSWTGVHVNTTTDTDGQPMARCYTAGDQAIIERPDSLKPFMGNAPETHPVLQKGFALGARSVDLGSYNRFTGCNPSEMKFRF